jgi:flagellar biosynthesis/type III secretory pathway chaperone
MNLKAENTSHSNSVDTNGGVDGLYHELVECLDGLIKIYRNLLDVVRREKEILVASRLDELNDNNKAKDAMLVRVRSLENTRMKCARDLAQAVGSDVEQPRLLEIATRVEHEKAQRLRNLHSALELLVKRVAEVNKQNEELVQAALNNITGAMDAIRDGLKPKPTYARQGSMAPSKSDGPHLVSREA